MKGTRGGRSCCCLFSSLFFWRANYFPIQEADCNTSSPSSSLQQKDLFPSSFHPESYHFLCLFFHMSQHRPSPQSVDTCSHSLICFRPCGGEQKDQNLLPGISLSPGPSVLQEPALVVPHKHHFLPLILIACLSLGSFV